MPGGGIEGSGRGQPWLVGWPQPGTSGSACGGPLPQAPAMALPIRHLPCHYLCINTPLLIGAAVLAGGPQTQVVQDVADGGDGAAAAQDHVGDQAGPAGLVERAERGTVVAVEVLTEDQVVPPGGIGLHPL